jgi:protein tyrosine/serine phosphatase
MSALIRRRDAPATARPAHWAEPLPQHGIENLHRLTPQLLRSAQPRAGSLAALRDLGVRTMVSFRAFNGDEDDFSDSGIRLVRVPINTWHIRDRHIVRALAAIGAAERQGAVLIHCLHGADRTGVISALYRMVVQGWDKEAARLEMLRGGFGYHTMWRNIPSYLDGVDARQITAALRSGHGRVA